MSRQHAEIEADFHKQASNAPLRCSKMALQCVINTSQAVKIRDLGSMHGTLLNGEQVGDESRPLVAGDEVTFGMPVYRNQTIFKPASMTVGLEFQNALVMPSHDYRQSTHLLTIACSARANSSPSRVFTVPDDCSTDENIDENEPIDDDVPIGTSLTLAQQKALVEANQNMPPSDTIRQMDGVIEIDSESAPNDLISISSDDDDDDESISLTDNEETSSVPASPVDSADLDDTVQMDGNATRSPSWNRVPTDSESEHMDDDSASNRMFSDNEQGVFLYDSDDSEDMDEMDTMTDDDQIDPVVDASAQPSHLFPMQPLPVLPSLSAAVLSPPYPPDRMVPFGFSLPPVGWSVHRQPSPSDAVIPPSHRHYGSEDVGAMAAENLGHKWGKPEFFEAREHNKMTISRLTEPKPSTEVSLVADEATNTDTVTAEDNSLRGDTKGSEDRIEPSVTETGHRLVPEPSQGVSRAEDLEQDADHPVEKHAPEDTQVSNLTHNPWLESGDEFLRCPLREAPAKEQATTNAAEAPEWTPASAYELHQYKQQNLAAKEQDVEVCDDPMDNSIASNNPVKLLEESLKGKRKAADISEATEHELVWHDKGDSVPPVAPNSPATPEPNVSLPTPPVTPQAGDRADAQPSKKIRKIAERVGYAALGGATVGAMVFTSLIYTAPSFA